MVPPCVSSLVAAAPAVGFSGSRSPAAGGAAAVAAVAAFVPPSAVVAVGCAKGIDAIAARIIS